MHALLKKQPRTAKQQTKYCNFLILLSPLKKRHLHTNRKKQK